MSDNMDSLASSLFPSMSGDANVPNGTTGKPADTETKSVSQPAVRTATEKPDAGKEALQQTKALAGLYDKSDTRERAIMDAAKEEFEAEHPQGPQVVAATSEDVSAVVQDWGMSPNESTAALGDWAGQHGVSRDAVNQLMEIRDSHMAALAEAQSDAWYDETMSSVDAFTIEGAKAGLDRYGDQEFRDMLAQTGVGNHPAMVRFLSNVAKGKSR